MSDRQQPVVRVDDQFVLRPWTQEDVPALVAAFADPDIQHWNLNSFDEAGAKRLVAKWNDAWSSETGAYWAIARSSDDFAIGQVGLRAVDLTGGEAEIWYWIAPGYALEGTKISALLHSDGWHDTHWHARVNDVEVEGQAL